MTPIAPDRLDGVLALNNAHAAELSLLDHDRLAGLVRQALWAAQIGEGDGFILLLDETAAYDSPNFRWFKDRFERFAYVDRVVVAPVARGRGLARRLYAGAFAAASAAGQRMVAAEVNRVPPNPASDAFHGALGFREVGQASIHGGTRTVRYLTRDLP
jgi:predicted GNAT superfamily acetyltransferase